MKELGYLILIIAAAYIPFMVLVWAEVKSTNAHTDARIAARGGKAGVGPRLHPSCTFVPRASRGQHAKLATLNPRIIE